MTGIRVWFPRRKSTDAPQPNFTVSYGSMSMTVDIDRIPGELYKKLPDGGFANAKAEDWRPFCVQAVAMGLMR